MANKMAEGVAWLAQKLRSFAGVSVTYRRGSSSVSLTATVGQSTFESVAPDTGMVVNAETRDYLVTAAALVLDGSAILPALGDQIREVVKGQTLVFEVMSPAGGAHFQWSDPAQQILRIHTRQVGVE